jgi:hypothetical protein
MGQGVKPNQHDMDSARFGVILQYTSMFDEPTRKQMEELGINKFIDHVILLQANQAAWVRYYANFMHPKSEENSGD